RGGPAAVGRVRSLADGGFSHSFAYGAGCLIVTAFLCGYLSRYLPIGILLHAAPRAQRTRRDGDLGPDTGRPAANAGPSTPRDATKSRTAMTDFHFSFVGVWTVLIAAGILF